MGDTDSYEMYYSGHEWKLLLIRISVKDVIDVPRLLAQGVSVECNECKVSQQTRKGVAEATPFLLISLTLPLKNAPVTRPIRLS